jgi:transcriptional regulator with XRE-family HTH domain
VSMADGIPAANEDGSASEGRAYNARSGMGPRDANGSRFARANRPLHRLATVRKQQGISLGNVARQLGVSTATACDQEEETTELPLSLIYAWQKIFDVPAVELLVDSDAPFSPSVLNRARLIRVMKTAATIRERAQSHSVKTLVSTLIDDLLEIMPELREVVGWNTVGQRRTQDELGQVVDRQPPDDFYKRRTR